MKAARNRYEGEADTTRTQYGAMPCKAEKGNTLKNAAFANPCNAPIVARDKRAGHPSLVEWIYCNQADTHGYRMD